MGYAVAQARVSLGISQQELADRIGLGRSSVANLERGRQVAALVWVRGLCRALGVSADELLGIERKG